MAPAIDRLSLLPESLITVILSLIPLKDAVQTSVLSKYWINLWKTIFNIEINTTDFLSHSNCLNFTHRWFLAYPNDEIERFSLTIARPIRTLSRSIIENFIDFAIKHKTKALELEFHRHTSFELPKIVYEYESLTVLKLFSCNFAFSRFVNVSSLKTLSFGRMALEDATLRDFLDNCGELESLGLYECKDTLYYTVVSESLEFVVVDHCNNLVHLILRCPKLKSFKYVGRLVKFHLYQPWVIDEVDLNFANKTWIDEDSSEMIFEALMAFRRSRVLTLCNFTMQSMYLAPIDSWIFPKKMRTKHLTLSSTFHHTEYYGIINFMMSCPILEKIQFQMKHREIHFEEMEQDYDDEDEDEYEVKQPCEGLLLQSIWTSDLRIPKCFKNTLQEVEINGFKGTHNEMWFLEFLFRHGLVLRTVRLRFAKFHDGEPMEPFEEVTREMSTWERNSRYRLNILFE